MLITPLVMTTKTRQCPKFTTFSYIHHSLENLGRDWVHRNGCKRLYKLPTEVGGVFVYSIFFSILVVIEHWTAKKLVLYGYVNSS